MAVRVANHRAAGIGTVRPLDGVGAGAREDLTRSAAASCAVDDASARLDGERAVTAEPVDVAHADGELTTASGARETDVRANGDVAVSGGHVVTGLHTDEDVADARADPTARICSQGYRVAATGSACVAKCALTDCGDRTRARRCSEGECGLAKSDVVAAGRSAPACI